MLTEDHQPRRTDVQVDDIVMWETSPDVHMWRIRGIHLGAPGVESLIELENLSHKPGWTGEWETHQMISFLNAC
jgi:hypothetical protein